jgi:hypothetical protein
MSMLVSAVLAESVVCYCCLCTVVFNNLITFAMQENIEQRYTIILCMKLNESATETFAFLTKANGDATLPRITVFKWHKTFKDSREVVVDDPHSVRPILSIHDQNVEVV